MPLPDRAHEQAEKAAAEAASIGGRPRSYSDDERPDAEAQRPLTEAGQGESEGFEQAEQELVEHATHGDQHAARRILEDAPTAADDPRAAGSGEPDHERSSERETDDEAA
jgi:hypothetical protein